MNVIKNWIGSFYLYLMKQTIDARRQIPLFAIVMSINYPLFGIFWKLDGFQLNEEFSLRMIATFLCLSLSLYKFWPNVFKKALPILWFVTLLFCLPFFFAYLTLINHGAMLWLMNCMSAVFFLFLVASVVDAICLLIVGSGLAYIYYISDISHANAVFPDHISLFGLGVTFLAAIIIGALFARDREIRFINELSGIQLMSGNLAHDLRTPLANIHLQTELQEIIVENLSNPDVKKGLKESLNKIGKGVHEVNNLINIQLKNIQTHKFDTRRFAIHSIESLLKPALEEYPYKQNQQDTIQINWSSDYLIWIEESAFKILVWNLLKNSLDSIEEAGKGQISIWLSTGEDKDNFNYLHIKDTASGISSDRSQIIFEPFYSEKKGATGIGLAYCKSLMKAAAGSITCKGMMGEYIHFIIKFPKID